MADSAYTLSKNPTYHTAIRALQDSDEADACQTFNPLIQQLVDNIHHTKLIGDGLMGDGPICVGVTIPVSGWSGSDSTGYSVSVPCAAANAEHIPYVSLTQASLNTASACGLSPTVEAVDGALKFFAAIRPAAAMVGKATFIVPYGSGAGGINAAALPIATADTLGAIKGSESIHITQDGAAHAQLSNDLFVSDEEVEQALSEIYDTGKHDN